MPHLRKRHISGILKKYTSFWPVVGVLGLRQSGKTTLFEKLVKSENKISLDDRGLLDEIAISPKSFLSKYPSPLLIDEAQKSPEIFDAIKLQVDRKKIPGSYLLTGSSQFSSKIGIRESLTGRIGLLHLYPFTLAEAHQLPFESRHNQPNHLQKNRFTVEDFSKQLSTGGLPVPLFSRDTEMRKSYFKEWLDTTVHRDVALAYGKNYNIDFAWSLLDQFGTAMKNADLVTVQSFKQDSRKVNRYLDAFRDVFLVHKIPVHEEAVGRDAWMITDVGIANHLMNHERGEGALLSQVRIQSMNEILATVHYSGQSLRPVYYKTARGHPVDLIWNHYALKFSVSKRSQIAYDERPLESCIKKLKLKGGFISTPYDSPVDTKSKIKIVSWAHWS
jgi:predicted AAA+ superfamily ATPase